MLYNIYAGLGGSFGGANYKGTIESDNIDDVEEMAYDMACEEYESYAGLHGLRSISDIEEEVPNTDNLSQEVYDDDIFQMYCEERETWLDYYVVETALDREIHELVRLD